MTKLHAFTIMELMVVALLSVVLVGAGLTAFRLIESQYLDYAASSEESLDLQELHRLLQEDALAAEVVLLKEGQLIFQFKEHQLRYQVSTQEIIRQPLIEEVRGDTFAIGGVLGAAFWQGLAQSEGPIDWLDMSLKTKEKSYQVLLNKAYSAEERMRFRIVQQ